MVDGMSNLKASLKNLDISRLKLKNGKSVETELKRHAAILADCILDQLDKVYDAYEPKIYKRTYNLYNSVCVDNKVVAEVTAKGAALSITVGFDEGALHTGLDGKIVNTAVLLNEGWQTHGKFANVPYFGYREPTHFIEKAIEAYKQKVSDPFEVQINKNYNT